LSKHVFLFLHIPAIAALYAVLVCPAHGAPAVQKPLPAVEIVWGEPVPVAGGEIRVEVDVKPVQPVSGIRVEIQPRGGLVPSRPLPRYEGLATLGVTRRLSVQTIPGSREGAGLLATVEVETPAGTYPVGSFLPLGPRSDASPMEAAPDGAVSLGSARVEVREAGSVSPGATATVRFLYRDRSLGPDGFVNDLPEEDPLRPIRFADVVAKVGASVQAMGHTDEAGEFTFSLGGFAGETFTLWAKTSTADWGSVSLAVHPTGSMSLYALMGNAVLSGGETVDIVAEPGAGGEAFNIYDNAVEAFGYLAYLLGSDPPDPLDLFWSPTSTTGTYFSRGASQIQFLADDGYDDPVILHEVGHYVLWYHSLDQSPGGIHYIDDAQQDVRLAWSEGWCSFFQAAVRAERGDAYPSWYIDTLGQPGRGGLYFSYECEGPSLYLRGSASEVVVHALLWDIIDGPLTEGDPQPGIDDDPLVLFLDRIWRVVSGPMLTATSVSLEDFWDGWFDRSTGFAHRPEIEETFGALGVEIFPDSREPDDDPEQATPLSLDGTPVHHSFGSVGDVDYHRLELVLGDSVTVETTNLVGLGDTLLRILRPDGTEAASNDDRDASDFSSFLTFQADTTGTWLVRVERSFLDALSTHAAYGSYDIRALAGTPRNAMLERASISTGVRNGGFGLGIALADYDEDGATDLYLVNSPDAGPSYAADVLYRNRGTLVFEDASSAAGLGFTDGGVGAAWGDYDNDGDLDLFVTDHALYRNEGDGTFTDVTESSGVIDIGREFDAAWVDVQGDGLLDLFVLRRDGPSALWRNGGNGTFTDVAAGAGFGFLPEGEDAYGCAWGDYDGDGAPDLFVARRSGATQALYRNLGGAKFEEVTGPAGLASDISATSGSWGDVDGDGDLDLFVTARGPDRLYVNEGDGTFTEDAARWGVASLAFSQAAAFADVDLDGDLDLYVTHLSEPNALYENLGGRMVRNGEGADPGQGRGCAWGDLDGDGDLDLYVARGCDTSCQANVLYENLTNDANVDRPPRLWLGVRTVGTLSNRDGLGAKVRVYAGPSVQFREVGTGVGWASKSRVPEWFGFPDGLFPDSLVVDWPSGLHTVVPHPSLYAVVEVVEEAEVPVLPPREPGPIRVSEAFPNPFRSAVTVGFTLEETSPVRIEVFDLQGRRVRRILDRTVEPGDHVFGWDGEDDHGRDVAPGLYFYRLQAGSTVVVRKLVRFQ